MMRSMFSAISGLRNHQTFMDVVGNNIANVNTTGFKQSRVTFQDILSQTIRGASSPQGQRGGMNPAQVGLGMSLAGVDTVQTQGTLQSTNKLTDMAIQGDGFFVLSDGASQVYSRDGSFDIGTDGRLVNPANGLLVRGWQADANGLVDTAGPLTDLRVPIGQGMEGQASKEATIDGNLDQLVDHTDWASSNPASGKLTIGSPTTSPVPAHRVSLTVTGGLVSGMTLQRWDAATNAWVAAGTSTTNSITDATYGLTFTVAESANNMTGDVYYTNAQASTVTLYDSLGEAHSVRTVLQKTPNLNSASTADDRDWTWVSSVQDQASGQIQVGTGVLSFDNAGKVSGGGTGGFALTAANGAIKNGAADINASVALSAITQLAGSGDLTSSTDGAPAGTLATFTVGQTGEISGIYTNGLRRTIGQIAVASFANPSGLQKAGGNLMTVSANSGDPRIGAPGSNGRGQLSTGFLEMSNVDLAQQFTNMIMAQRGFQANSRVISSSDEILQDLVNLKR